MIGGIYDSVAASPEKALHSLPDTERWSDLKAALVTNMANYNRLKHNLANPPAPGELPYETNQYWDLYPHVKKEKEFISDPKKVAQAALDKKVEQMFIECDGNTEKFQQWYYTITQDAIDAKYNTLLTTIVTIIQMLARDRANKVKIDDYQKWMLKVQEYWSNFLDTQINEHTALLENMDSLLSTQQRVGAFTHADMTALDQWQYWVTVVLVVLLTAIVVLALIRNAGRFSQLATRLRATIGDKSANKNVASD